MLPLDLSVEVARLRVVRPRLVVVVSLAPRPAALVAGKGPPTTTHGTSSPHLTQEIEMMYYLPKACIVLHPSRCICRCRPLMLTTGKG